MGTALTPFIHVGDQEGTNRHRYPAHQTEDEHGGGEDSQVMTEDKAGDGQHHQQEAKAQLGFQRYDFHQPGVQEDRDQNTGIKESKGITHAGHRQIKVLCDVSHHHPGDDHQCPGQGVGEEANP